MLSPTDDGVSALYAAIDTLAAARMDAMDTGQRMTALAALTEATRRLAAVENTLIAGIRREAIPAELAGSLTTHLTLALRITPAEAAARLRDAEDVGPHTALNGEPLPPRFPNAAAALAAGRIGRQHVREIHTFFTKLPAAVTAEDRDDAERFLADVATTLSPDQLRKAAAHLAAVLGHEDSFSDADRARRRSFTWSHQDADGMSKATLWATPALRAELDTLFAAWAAPGKCNPDDETPCVDDEPDPEIADRDARTPPQRRHDALSAVARAMLASGQLGRHHGLPVTLVVTATLQDLQAGSGTAHTGGGTALPITDVVRMATHANHYLALFDGVTGAALWLGRTRRIAAPGQRIVLHARDRGCTFPGCSTPGYLTEVHHLTDWARGGPTNIDNLTFACRPHHALVTSHGWTTTKSQLGHAEWIPPPQQQLPNGTNPYHHPERYLDP